MDGLIRECFVCSCSCYNSLLSTWVVVSVEEKKEETKAEESDSDNEDMGFGLFD